MLENTIRSFALDKSLTISVVGDRQPEHLRRLFDFNNYQVDYKANFQDSNRKSRLSHYPVVEGVDR